MFGKKFTYLYGNVIKNMFISGEHAYKIEEEDLNIIKESGIDYTVLLGVLDEEKKLKIFPNETFIINSYIIDETEDSFIWFDSKKKLIKSKKYEKCIKNKFYICKIIDSTENGVEVEVPRFEEKKCIPGQYCKGKVSYKNKQPFFTTEFGSGKIILQTNEQYADKEVSAVVIEHGDKGVIFAEVYNPVKYANVKIVNTFNGLHFVENENIKGVCLLTDENKEKTELCVKTKEIRLGSYLFEESNIVFEKFQFFKLLKYTGEGENIFIVSTQKTKEKFKAKIVGNNPKKFFGGMIVDYSKENDCYIIDIASKDEKHEEKKFTDDLSHVYEEIKSSWEINALPIFIKYETFLYTDNNLLKLYLEYLNNKNLLEIDEVKKYLVKFLKREKAVRMFLEVKNKQVTLFLFNKKRTFKVFESLITLLEEEEIKQHCANNFFKGYYFEYLVKNEKYEEAVKMYDEEEYSNLLLKISKPANKQKFQEFINCTLKE